MAAVALAAAMAAPSLGRNLALGQAVPHTVDAELAEQRAASNGNVLLAQAQGGSASETLKQAQDQFKSGAYEDAVSTLQSIDASTLSDKDRRTLSDMSKKAQAAADQRRAARAEFEQGQADLNASKPGAAAYHFKQAADNKYADKGTQSKAKEQIALAENMQKSMAGEMKKTYANAVAQYKRGELAEARTSFQLLSDQGYKPGAFQKSPQDFIKDINKRIGPAPAPQAEAPAPETPAAPAEAAAPGLTPVPAPATETPATPAPTAQAAPAPSTETPAAPAPTAETPATEAPNAAAAAGTAAAAEAEAPVNARRAYLKGRDQYRKGDWINARKNLEMARNAGYKPGLFEDKPSEILARMDRKEQADAAKAQSRAEAMAAADANRQPTAQAAPEAAPATPNLPAAVAQPVAQAPTPAPSTPATPATPAAPATPQQELESTAQLDKIRAEQHAAEARQLVEQGRTAQNAGRYPEALDAYSRAQQLDPNNAQAAAGAREMAAMTGRGEGGGNLLQRQAEAASVARQEIQYTIDTELKNAADAARNGNFDAARAALDRASAAANLNPQVFTEAENRSFRSRIDQTQVAVNSSETSYRARQEADAQTKINQAIAEQKKNEDIERRRTVADLINNSKHLVSETRYGEALGVIDQILVLDPTNDYASGVRPLVEDKANFQQQRRYREEHDRQMTKQLNAAEEMKIPYDDILRYPTNWPDISELRDQTTATELGGSQADQATQLLLERRLPELKLDNIPFTDVVDALRDLTNANIFVNWRALEAEGVDRATPITARLRDVKFAKALDTVLRDVGGGTVQLGYTIDEGVITISTQTDLAKNTLTRVYDIRDLIVEIPDFTDAPQFQLQQQGQTSGRGGGGGGGQSLFGGQGGTGQGTDQGQRATLITEITELIQETVDPESWREAGGSVGSIRILGGNLIVNQTPSNHRALQGLLEQLRESQSIQITIEARFLTVQRNYLEDIGVDVDFTFNTNQDANSKWSPIPVTNNSSVFTANPITGIPGSIGNVAPSTQNPDDPLSTGVGVLGLSGTYLDNFAVTFLVRATQATQNSTIVTAPRVTLSNGQRGYVVVSTQTAYVSDLEPVVGTRAVGFDPTISIIESGILLDVQGTVSADRKYVTLTLRPTLSRLAALQPFTVQSAAQTTGDDNTVDQTGIATATLQQPIVERTLVRTTVTVPDGGTLLLGGQTLAGEVEREAGVPVLSKIPFLKRLFTNRSMAKDEQVLLILVKPTIIIAKEQERKQFPVLSTRVGQ